MRLAHTRRLALGLAGLWLAACGPAATPGLTATGIPTRTQPPVTASPAADLTAIAFALTQTFLVGTATVPGPSATSQPATAMPVLTATPVDAGRAVTIPVSAELSLAGTVYGQGSRAVIFSNMGDQRQASWAPVAREMAAAGYLALTYEFRYWVNNRMDAAQIPFIADDLAAAVLFVRAQGAETVVLVGASLGGMATAKAAAQVSATAVVIMAAPMQAPGVEVAVTTAELQAFTGPKLFITSEFDDTVAAAELEAMYAAASEPKELYVYPGAGRDSSWYPPAEERAGG